MGAASPSFVRLPQLKHLNYVVGGIVSRWAPHSPAGVVRKATGGWCSFTRI